MKKNVPSKSNSKNGAKKISFTTFFASITIFTLLVAVTTVYTINSKSQKNVTHSEVTHNKVINSGPEQVNKGAVAHSTAITIEARASAPIVEKKDKTFAIVAPTIDSISLGSKKTVDDFSKLGYLTEVTENNKLMAFNDKKYNIYKQVASVTFDTTNDIVNKISFHFETADNKQLIEQFHSNYNFDTKYCEQLDCNVTLNGEKVDATFFTNSGIATIIYSLK